MANWPPGGRGESREQAHPWETVTSRKLDRGREQPTLGRLLVEGGPGEYERLRLQEGFPTQALPPLVAAEEGMLM